MKRKTVKRTLAAALSLVLVLSGLAFYPKAEMDTVQASDAASTYVWEDLEYATKYAKKAPICQTEGYFFGGWYDSEGNVVARPVAGTTYKAKFVPAEVLSVKCQVTANTTASTETTNLRVLTTADCQDYDEIGFDITLWGQKINVPMETVLEKVGVNTGMEAYNYSPNLFSLASTYYASVVIGNIPQSAYDDGFLIEPYWITANGTKVTGISRYMRVEDSYTNSYNTQGIVNVPVYLNDDAEISAGTTVTIKSSYSDGTGFANNTQYRYVGLEAGSMYDAEDIIVSCNAGDIAATITLTIAEGADAKEANGLLANLRFVPQYPLTGMQSRHKFAMTCTDNIKVLDVMHRNLLSNNAADQSYYSERSTSSVCIIATAAELKGFMQLSNTGLNYKNKTVYLVADLDVNPSFVASASSTAPTNVWKPAGAGISGTYDFQGTFDGQGHTIKGIYVNTAADAYKTYTNAGMFGYINGGTVKNVTLDNCYFNGSTVSFTGAIAGNSTGTIENVKVTNTYITNGTRTGGIVGNIGNGAKVITAYCDANIVNTTGNPSGGIAGKAHYLSTKATMTDCWYAGTLNCNTNAGGILGWADSSLFEISHCQNTGTMQVTANTLSSVGGLVGNINAGKNNPNAIVDSLNFSKLVKPAGNGSVGFGGIVGYINGGGETQIKKTYTVNLFRNTDVEPNVDYASGWTQSLYVATSKYLFIDGVQNTISNNYSTGKMATEMDLRYARISGGTDGSLPLSFDKGDGSDYYWVHDEGARGGVPRLKSFADIPFKRVQP